MNTSRATSKPKRRRLRQRYTLRTLLVLMLIAAVFASWWSSPTRFANAYVKALNAQKHIEAGRLCVGKTTFPDNPSQPYFSTHASLLPFDLESIWTGKRKIIVSVDHGDGHGISSYGVSCTATRQGIVVDPIIMP